MKKTNMLLLLKEHWRLKKIAVSFGGVPVEMIIDSGGSTNVIDKCLWENFKEKHKETACYGSTTPLTVIGTFTAEVNVAGKHMTTEFMVVEEKGEPLLGRKTAMES